MFSDMSFKKIILCLSVLLICLLILSYLIASFTYMTFNPKEFTETTRTMIIVIPIIVQGMVGWIVMLNKILMR